MSSTKAGWVYGRFERFRHVRPYSRLGTCLALALALSMGCKAKESISPQPSPADKSPESPFAELASAIDPGPQPPLVSQAPAWISQIAKPPPEAANPVVLEAHATAQLSAWQNRESSSPLMQVDALLGLLSAISVGEQLLADGQVPGPELLALLERTYGMFDFPGAQNPGSFLRQTFSTMMMAANRGNVLTEQAQVSEGLAFFDLLLEQAPTRRRHVAALLLRHYPDSKGAAVALQGIAADYAESGDYEKSLQLHEVAIERLAAQATFAHYSSYARASMAALDATRADRALQAAQAAEVPDSKRKGREEKLTQLRETRSYLQEYDQLQATDLPAQVRRAELLLLLGRTDMAAEILEKLQQQDPRDARVWILQAQYELSEHLDFPAAAKAADRARPLGPHNETYYEVALGTVVGVFMGDLLPKLAQDPKAALPAALEVLDKAARDAEGYAQYRPDRAAIIHSVLVNARREIAKGDDGSDSWGQRLVEELVAPARELVPQFPQSDEVARFAILAARFTSDRQQAIGEVRRDLPAALSEREFLLTAQRQTGLDLAVMWQDKQLLQSLAGAALAGTPPTDVGELLVYANTLSLASFHNGQTSAVQPAIDAYTKIIRDGETDDRLAALNNLSVLLASQGNPEKAREHLTTAVTHFPGKAAVPLINLAAVSPLRERPGLLAAVASNDPTRQAEILAWSRLAALLPPESADAKQVEQRLAELRAKSRAPLPRDVDGSWGALLSGTFDLGLKYSLHKRLQLDLKVDSRIWLVLPDPK